MATRRSPRRSTFTAASRTNGPTSTRPETRSGRLAAASTAEAGAHGVADDDRGAAEFLDQGDGIASGFFVSIGGETGVAVTVTAKVGARDSVPRVHEGGSEKAIPGPQVTHPGHEHYLGTSSATS